MESGSPMSKETFRNWLDKQSSTIDLTVLLTAQDRHGVDVALPDQCYESTDGTEPTVKKTTIRYSVWTKQ